jgi:hypothetical protein
MLCTTKTSCFVRFFVKTKKLNIKLESSFSEIASLWSVHYDMSVKPYDNCKMIMVNYADLWLVHAQFAKLELREIKAHSLLLCAYTSCHLFGYDLEASAV